MNTVCSIFVGWIVLLMASGNLNDVVVFCLYFVCLFVCIFYRFRATQQKIIININQKASQIKTNT